MMDVIFELSPDAAESFLCPLAEDFLFLLLRPAPHVVSHPFHRTKGRQ